MEYFLISIVFLFIKKLLIHPLIYSNNKPNIELFRGEYTFYLVASECMIKIMGNS